jgi:hypothetical protein
VGKGFLELPATLALRVVQARDHCRLDTGFDAYYSDLVRPVHGLATEVGHFFYPPNNIERTRRHDQVASQVSRHYRAFGS